MIEIPKGGPDPRRDLAIIDREAKAAGREAGKAALRVVQSDAPGSFAAGGLRSGVRGTGTGVAITVRPAPKSSQVLRWVNRGTGLFRQGPGAKTRITASKRGGRMVLPGGRKVYSVAGQHPNPFMDRNRERAALAAELALDRAGAAIATKLGGKR